MSSGVATWHHAAAILCVALGISAIGCAKWRPRWAAVVGALFAASATIAWGTGTALQEGYWSGPRQRLFVRFPELGTWFERKEHLAFLLLALSWAGTFAWIAGIFAARTDGDRARWYRRSALLAWTAAGLSAAVAGAIAWRVAPQLH